MSKLTILILVCTLCALERVYGNNFFYYPNTQGALNYAYQPPYVYSAYAAVPVDVDCDKSTAEGGEDASSESSSSESAESGESTESSSSESSSEETKEGESSSSGSSEEEGGKKEGSGEGKKENSKKKVVQYVFPPVSYQYPPQTAQQVVYSAPVSYMPYRAYSVVQQPDGYPVKSNGYSSYPYYSLSGIPQSPPSAPVANVISSPAGKVVSYPGVSKTITFGPASGVSGPAGYWNGNVGYYKV